MTANYRMSDSGFRYSGKDYYITYYFDGSFHYIADIWPMSGKLDIDCGVYDDGGGGCTYWYEHGRKAALEAALNGGAGGVLDAYAEGLFIQSVGDYSYTGNPSGWTVVSGDIDPPTLDLLILSAWTEVAPKYLAEANNYSLLPFNGKLYGGTGDHAYLVEWNGIDAWTGVAGPVVTTNPRVENLCKFNGKICGICEGKFLEWNGTDAWITKTSTGTSKLTVLNSKLYGTDGSILYEWDGADAWVAVTSAMSDGRVGYICTHNNKVYGIWDRSPLGWGSGILLEWSYGASAWVTKTGSGGFETMVMLVWNNKIFVGDLIGNLYRWNGSSGWDTVATGTDKIFSLVGGAGGGGVYGGTGSLGRLLQWDGIDMWFKVCDQYSTKIYCRSLTAFNGNIYGGVSANTGNTLLEYTMVPGPTPTLNAAIPNTGATSGGTPITLSGTNFVEGAQITIDDNPCWDITWISTSSITCTTPLGTAGVKDIVVINPDTQIVTKVGGFTYITEVIVVFPDPALEAAVRVRISKPVGDIYQSDLNAVAYFSAVNQGIVSLVGMEYWTSLTYAQFQCNNIVDVSPLAGLTSLTDLILSENSVVDVSPLVGLISLDNFDAGINNLTDISVISLFTKMVYLDLSYNSNLEDISPLSTLTLIDRMYLQDDNVSDISSLVGVLTSGSELHITGNPLNAEAYSTDIPALQADGVIVEFDPQGPAVLSLSPATGPTTGGTDVTIYGHNFVDLPSVYFPINYGLGDIVAWTDVAYIDEGTLTAKTPAGNMKIHYQISGLGYSYGGNDYTMGGMGGIAFDSTIVGGMPIVYTNPAILMNNWYISGAEDIDCSLVDGPGMYLTGFYRHSDKANAEAFVSMIGGVPVAYAASVFVPVSGVYSYTGDPSGWTGVDVPTITKIGNPGQRDVTVENSDGGVGTLSGGFTYTEGPVPPVSSGVGGFLVRRHEWVRGL